MGAGFTRKLSIDGNDFTLLSDTDLDKKPQYNFTSIPTSGDPMFKVEKNPLETGVFKVKYTKADELLLHNLQENCANGDLLQFTYVDTDSESFSCEGKFNIGNTSTSNGSIDVVVLPNAQWV
jgi:hypothetical protein